MYPMNLKSDEKKNIIRARKDNLPNDYCKKCRCDTCKMNYIISNTTQNGICAGCEMCIGVEDMAVFPKETCPIGKNV